MISLRVAPEGEGSIRRTYIFTGVLAVGGLATLWLRQGFKAGLAFFLGATVALGSLYFFGRLAQAISPSPDASKPWETRAFISRYLLLFAGGYVIVKTLDVSPLAVIFGMLTSAAALIMSFIIELFERLFARSTTR